MQKLTKIVKVKNFEKIVEEVGGLDPLFLLEMVAAEYDIKGFENIKIQSWVSGLIRKGLITEQGLITTEGKAALLLLDEEAGRNTLKKIKVERDENFKKWWNSYPSTNNFIYSGVKFPGSQNKRINEKECEVAFYKLINEEDFKAEDIISGTINHIELAKKLSYQSRENKLTYIANSLRYLTQKMFEPYIGKEEMKQEVNKDFEI